MKLRACQYEWEFPRPTLIVGILNVTPDSFSDGGRYVDLEAAQDKALAMAREGADLIDIGGESSRPGAEPISKEEELRRVLPILRLLKKECALPLSIDTSKSGVARAALEAGATIINDVGAARAEEGMWHLAAESGAAYVCMHSQGTPQNMQKNPIYQNVVEEVNDFLRSQSKE